MSKIKEEQLKELQDQVNSINQNQLKIGNLESQKHTLIHNGVELQNQLRTIQNTLEEEYGKVTINISTGEYKEVSEEVDADS
jgi:maltose-binding protein MalE